MKVLITGSSGMLGRDLARVFGKENQVVGIDISGEKQDDCSSFYRADITDPAKVNEIFDKERPDLVIHAAALTDVDGCETDPEKAKRINTLGTRNIAEACGDIGSPLIFISTDFVFDGSKNSPYTEDEETNPINVYGRTKWEAEESLSEACRDYAIVRTSWLFGEEGKNFVDTVVKKGKADKVLRVVDDQIGSPTYTKDLAIALYNFAKKEDISGSAVYHASNSGDCTWCAFARKIRDLAGGMEDVKVEPIPSSELDRPAMRPKYSVLDTSKFEMRSGCKMRSWQEALEEYIKGKYG